MTFMRLREGRLLNRPTKNTRITSVVNDQSAFHQWTLTSPNAHAVAFVIFLTMKINHVSTIILDKHAGLCSHHCSFMHCLTWILFFCYSPFVRLNSSSIQLGLR